MSIPSHDPRRRSLLAAAAALGAAPAVGLAASATATSSSIAAVDPRELAGVTLRIGTYKGNWRALLSAAKLEDAPYRIDWRELNNGLLHIEALNGDALDLGSGSEIPATFAVRQNANARFIAVIREDLNNQVTIARKETDIRSIADLKGKRVGYVRGTTSHYYLYKQLREAGLTFDDIRANNLTPADGLSAFDRGDIDAWAIYGYNGQLARTRYGGRVLKTGKGYLSGNFPIYANPKSLDDRLKQAAIADYLQRLRRAYGWANGSYLAFARAQSDETKVPVGDLIELFNNRSDDYDVRPVDAKVIASHQEVADAFQALGVLDAKVDVKPFWDTRYASLLRAPLV